TWAAFTDVERAPNTRPTAVSVSSAPLPHDGLDRCGGWAGWMVALNEDHVAVVKPRLIQDHLVRFPVHGSPLPSLHQVLKQHHFFVRQSEADAARVLPDVAPGWAQHLGRRSGLDRGRGGWRPRDEHVVVGGRTSRALAVTVLRKRALVFASSGALWLAHGWSFHPITSSAARAAALNASPFSLTTAR